MYHIFELLLNIFQLAQRSLKAVYLETYVHKYQVRNKVGIFNIPRCCFIKRASHIFAYCNTKQD